MAGSNAALICDTGALLDYLVEDAPDHRLFRSAIDRARARYVPALVLAERWQTAYLPVYALWAWVVVVVFPLVFGFR